MSARLADVASAVGGVIAGTGPGVAATAAGRPRADPASLVVGDVIHDSRTAAAADQALFACITGDRFDGHDFAAPSLQGGGVVALLTSRRLDLGVPEITVPDVRAVLGAAAAEVHGHPSRSLRVVGVTGTNGKTTTVRIAARAAAELGLAAAEIGTLTGARTTPEAPELQRSLAAARRSGADLVAMEVSSHALDQRRVDGTRFAAVGFTNLGVDHLDHHGDAEAYYQAKARLFTSDFAQRCVIDTGSAAGRRLAAETTLPTTLIDRSCIEELRFDARSARFRWRGQRARLGIGGAFNVANAVLAAELLVCAGQDPEQVAGALASVGPIPGRFEVVDADAADSEVTVIVDYAHTPDGLESLLGSARAITEGRLTVVFGAGGDRDRSKRPLMGAVAERLADRVVLTSDNPRGEPPATIIEQISAGMSRPPDSATADRRLAIRDAIASAGAGDVVVIAGKGHEKTQTTGADVVEFDDRAVAREELQRRLGAEQ